MLDDYELGTKLSIVHSLKVIWKDVDGVVSPYFFNFLTIFLLEFPFDLLLLVNLLLRFLEAPWRLLIDLLLSLFQPFEFVVIAVFQVFIFDDVVVDQSRVIHNFSEEANKLEDDVRVYVASFVQNFINDLTSDKQLV